MNGILPALLVVFITLKLLGVITWSWWLVLVPLWLLLGFLLVWVAVLLLAAWAS